MEFSNFAGLYDVFLNNIRMEFLSKIKKGDLDMCGLDFGSGNYLRVYYTDFSGDMPQEKYLCIDYLGKPGDKLDKVWNKTIKTAKRLKYIND